MRKNLFAKLNKPTLLPVVVVVFTFIIAGSIAYAFAPKPHATIAKVAITEKKVAMTTKKQKPSVTPEVKVLGANTQKTSWPTAEVAKSPTATPVPHSTQTASNTTTSGQQTTTNTLTQQTTQNSSPTVTPQPTTAPTTASVTNTVSMQVQDPAGTSNFMVTLKNGANACDVLQEAKDEGKINSVTFDDSYMASLHSRYVTQINGYANNWTFTINGSSPNGCSLSNPKPNDSIVWKYS